MGNSDSDDIDGPLGIWTFPILNALVAISNENQSPDSTSTTETAKVIRDSNGEVQEVVVIKE